MKSIKYILAIIIMLVCTVNGYSAQNHLSKKLKKEWKNFLESQIPEKDKEFLDELAMRFQDLSVLNANASQLFRRTALKQLDAKGLHYRLKKHSRLYLSLFRKQKHPLLLTEQFTDHFRSSDELKDIIDDILMLYQRCNNMSFNANDGPSILSTATGAYYYLNIKLKDFEDDANATITQLLDYAYRKYDVLAQYAENHDIEALALNAKMLSSYFANAQVAIENNLTQPLEVSNQSWANTALLTVIDIVDKHFLLNAKFCKAINLRTTEIKIPQPPSLPDLIILGIEINIPKGVKIRKTVKVVIEVKNIGDLTASASKMLVIMPNGSKKKPSLPKLASGQTHSISLSYRIRKGGDNVFISVANYNKKIFEVNYNNNTAKRSLILPENPK